jgi:hypothetical protein
MCNIITTTTTTTTTIIIIMNLTDDYPAHKVYNDSSNVIDIKHLDTITYYKFKDPYFYIPFQQLPFFHNRPFLKYFLSKEKRGLKVKNTELGANTIFRIFLFQDKTEETMYK